MSKNTKTRENQVRRQLARQGYRLQKSRSDGTVRVNGVYQGENMDDRGGYRIVDDNTEMIVAGEKFDLSLEDVERLAAEDDTDNQEPKFIQRWIPNQCARAAKLDMELRQDSDGCYWLDYVDQPDMRSHGPFDLDEVEDWLTAAENRFSSEQTEEYMADQRWKRLHPEPEVE